jgi:trigger factor
VEEFMKVQVENVDRVRRKIEVVLEDDQVRLLEDLIYDDLRKHAKIKGFRPGKVPRSVLATYYKDVVDEELKKKIAESTLGAALAEAKVNPVSEPVIQFLDEQAKHGYTMECEVFPEFDLPPYRGLEVEVESLKVTPEEVDNRLESLKQMHAQLVAKEGGEAQKSDYVIVKYEGSVAGKPLKGAQSDNYPLDLGSSSLLPEFEAAIIGMKVGEEKEVEIDFAADYPDKDVAGKRALFKILLKEIKEKKLPEINDDFAKDMGYQDLASFREGVTREIMKQKETQRKNAISEKMIDQLAAAVDIPVPAGLLERRVASMVQDAKQRMMANPVAGEEERNIDGLLRKEFEPQAEKGIRGGMIISRIAEAEGLKVEESEIEERIKKIAEDTKRGYDYIKEFYEKHNLTDNLRSSMIEEKTIEFLIENGVIKETA